MAKSYYLDNAFLNTGLRATAYTPPVTVYCALFTATPGPSGDGTEVNFSAVVPFNSTAPGVETCPKLSCFPRQVNLPARSWLSCQRRPEPQHTVPSRARGSGKGRASRHNDERMLKENVDACRSFLRHGSMPLGTELL